MTKKDYIKLAEILREYHYNIRREMVMKIADWLKADSDKFDEDKFYKAIYEKKK